MKVVESRNDSNEDIIGIEVDKNSIIIPAEVFKDRETGWLSVDSLLHV